jgi:hypothetical protein
LQNEDITLVGLKEVQDRQAGDSSKSSTGFIREETLQRGGSSQLQNPLLLTDLEEVKERGLERKFSWVGTIARGS